MSDQPNDPGLMAPTPEPERGPLLGRWQVSEYEAASGVPAHFELRANGVLIAWGEPANAPAVITLCRLAAVALRCVPREQLTAELNSEMTPTSEGDVRSRLTIAGAWRPSPS